MWLAILLLLSTLSLKTHSQGNWQANSNNYRQSFYRRPWYNRAPQPRNNRGQYEDDQYYNRDRYQASRPRYNSPNVDSEYRETSYGPPPRPANNVNAYTSQVIPNSYRPVNRNRDHRRVNSDHYQPEAHATEPYQSPSYRPRPHHGTNNQDHKPAESYQPKTPSYQHSETVYKPRDEHRQPPYTAPSDGSGEDDCAMMKNPRGVMDSKIMKDGCKSYKAWGESMKAPSKWSPTNGQMLWWKSLSMPMAERSAYHRRHKRQTQQLRKEYRSLSDQARQAFHNAVRGLKNSFMDGTNKYDIFVGFHQSRMAPGAHFGCAFYVWHRELLLRFERALQTIDPSVTLPYFDSNLDYHLGNDLAVQTVTWTADFAGNGDGFVRTGPFADWSLPFPVDGQNRLFRNLTYAPRARTAPSLMSDQALNTILNARQYRDITWNVDSSFESFHGATHNWMGGVMVNLPASPSDPMFFLHHGFIDCLFTWMRNNQRQRGVNVDFNYPNDTQAMGVGMRRQGDGRRIQRPEDSLHYALAEMQPFGPLRNIDGMSSLYEDIYQCAPRPTCSRSDTSCGGSAYLFCDESRYRCAPKLRLGATCQRHSRFSPCARGQCCNGVCQQSCQQEPAEEVQRQSNSRQQPREQQQPQPNSPREQQLIHVTADREDQQPDEPISQQNERTGPNQANRPRMQQPPNSNHQQENSIVGTNENIQPMSIESIPQPIIETMHGLTETGQELPQSNEDVRVEQEQFPPNVPTFQSNPDEGIFEPEQPNLSSEHTVNENQERSDFRSDDSNLQRFSEDTLPNESENQLQTLQAVNNEENGAPELFQHSQFPPPSAPTHSPYTIPILPPIPTHAPYVIAQAPTHPPGHQAPTHPPFVLSAFVENENNVISVKRRSLVAPEPQPVHGIKLIKPIPVEESYGRQQNDNHQYGGPRDPLAIHSGFPHIRENTYKSKDNSYHVHRSTVKDDSLALNQEDLIPIKAYQPFRNYQEE